MGNTHAKACGSSSAGAVAAPPTPATEPETLYQSYNVIIVGSGLGGLSAASTLAQTRGLRCLVVEQHWTPGGMTHQFLRKDGEKEYWFSTGTHYVGQLGGGNMMSKLMAFVSKNVIWDKLPDEFEVQHYPGGRTFSQPADREEWKARLQELFPDEVKAISEYFCDLDTVGRWYQFYFMQQAVGWPLSSLCGWLAERGRRYYSQFTAQQYVDARIKSEELKGVLLGLWGDYGLRPNDVTFMQHALSARNSFGGCYHPRLGSRQIAQSIIPIIEAAGGRVMTSTLVKEIVVEHGVAVGVRIEQEGRPQRFIRATTAVVSACGAYNTFRRLLSQPLFPELESPRLINAGYSTIALYVGLKSDPKEKWGLTGATLRLYSAFGHSDTPLYDPQTGDVGHVILCPTSLREHKARAHCLDIFTFTSPESFGRWQGTEWGARGEEYAQVKAKIGKDVLGFIERWLPGIREEVEYLEIGTPLTWEKFTAWKDGTIYGVPGVPEKLQYMSNILRPTTPIKSLYLAGCDASMFGLVGAMMGGVMAAAHLLYPYRGLIGMLPEIDKVMASPGWDNILKLEPEAAAAVVESITDETPDTRTLTFRLPMEALERFDYKEGQYVVLIMDIDHSEVRRCYSISSSPHQLPLLSITVKQLPGGMASTYLHALKEGDTVYLLPPAGDFVLQPLVAPADRAPTGQVHLFFAAGSGIAPVLPMLTSALAKGESAALLYCSRRRADVIFQTELDKLVAEQEDLVRREAGQRRGRILLLQHCFSKELRPAGRAQSAAEVGAAAERGMPTVVNVVADSTVGACTQQEWCGRLTGKRVQSFYRTATSRAALGASSSPASAASASVVQCYMCGPAEWMDVIQQALEEEGVPCAAIHSEDFGAAEGLLAVDYEAAGVQAETRSAVIMDKNASERKVVVEAYQSVLNAALSRGVAVPYSCKTGSCKTCTAKVLCGTVLDIEDGLISNGTVLTCRVTPADDGVTLQL